MMMPSSAWPKFWEMIKNLMINQPENNQKPGFGAKDSQNSVTATGWRLPALVCLTSLLALLVLSGCNGEIIGSPAAEDRVQHQNSGKDENLMENKGHVLKTAKPPIDLKATPLLETATLAMG